MEYAIHICSFSSDVAQLKGKDKKDPLKVLNALSQNPRISTFDMSENRHLRSSIKFLEMKGFIVPIEESYPWHRWDITELGKQYLHGGYR